MSDEPSAPTFDPPLKNDEDISIPADFGPYKIIREIGEGGWGFVFLAEHCELRALVALKILKPELAKIPDNIRLFKKEAQVQKQLQGCKNIVHISNIGKELSAGKDLHWIELEYIKGFTITDEQKIETELQTLAHWAAYYRGVKQSFVPEKMLKQVALDILNALDLAHRKNMTHCDVKPENILIAEEEQCSERIAAGYIPKFTAKLSDFGIVKVQPKGTTEHDLNITNHTMMRGIRGSIKFLSPEQGDENKEIDHRSDLYGLGATLYYCLTNRYAEGRFKLPNELYPSGSLHPRWDDLLDKALQAEPDDRWQSAAEMAQAIRNIPTTDKEKKQEEENTKKEELDKFKYKPRKKENKKIKWSILALILVSSTLVVAFWYLQKYKQITFPTLLENFFDKTKVVSSPIARNQKEESMGIESSQTQLQQEKNEPTETQGEEERASISLQDLTSESLEPEPEETKTIIIDPIIIEPTETQDEEERASISLQDLTSESVELEPKETKIIIIDPIIIEPTETQAEEEIPKAIIEEEIPKAVIEKLPQAYKKGERKKFQIHTDVTVAFRWCPPTGEKGFLMGSPRGEKGRSTNEKQHKVILTKGFWMAETECTQAQWQAVMGKTQKEQIALMLADKTKYKISRKPLTLTEYYKAWYGDDYKQILNNFAMGDDYPIWSVSWHECQAFIKKVNANNTLTKGLKASLPTEAQWEYACRAGSKNATYNGNLTIKEGNYARELDAIAWYGGNSSLGYPAEKSIRAGARKVKEKKGNTWGLHDMIGNVWEWCSDWHEHYAGGTQIDPKGATAGYRRILRGSYWESPAKWCRSACRAWDLPSSRQTNIGFRLVLQVSED